MSSRSILFFCPREVNATMGGIERVTDTLARHLIAAGYNVVFMSVERTCNEAYHCVAPQYFVRPSGNEQLILEVIRKHDIGLIVNQMGLFSYCAKASLPAHVKVITVMHDSYYAMYPRLQLNFLRRWNWRRVIRKLMRNIYDQSDKIVLFVPPFKDEYRFFCPYATDDKFAVIPNFNSYDHPHLMTKEKKLLWVGRHAEWHKRTTDMLKIWQKLESQFPDWSLDILGDGPDGKTVRKLYDKWHMERCHLRGVVNPEPYYEKAAIVCMTSSFESFGMVLTEGMQHGCVPVAYDSYTAVRYIIHDGYDGLLVSPFNIDEYAAQLSGLMQHADERERLSAAALESVKQFDASRIVPQWLALIESMK